MGRNEMMIHKERQRDKLVAHYAQLKEADARLKNRIQWENQTETAIHRNNVGRITRRLEASEQASVEARRARLVALLSADDAQLKRELSALQETPHERRERLQHKAAAIRAEKDERRRVYVEQQLRRQFRETTDDLRLAGDQKLIQLCQRDRHQQLEMKALKAAGEELQKEKWEALWDQSRQTKLDREHQELEQRRRMNSKTYDEIDQQLESIRIERERARQAKEHEADERARILQEETDREAEQHRHRLERASAQRAEIEKFNAEFLAKKADEARSSEQDEAAMATLPGIGTSDVDEKRQGRRQELIEDMHRFLDYRQQQQHQSRDQEQELEALRAVELARLSRKQDLIWQKEQLARERLMREVIDSRRLQLLEKAEVLRRERELQGRGTSSCILTDPGEDGARAAITRAELAESLEKQIEERQFQLEMEKAERHHETLEAQLAEQEYQRRLHAELQSNLTDQPI